MIALSTDLAGNLRDWARGVYSTEAATELLARVLVGRLASADRPSMKAMKHGRWMKLADVENHIDSPSGGEHRLLRIGTSIGSSDPEPVILGDLMCGPAHPL